MGAGGEGLPIHLGLCSGRGHSLRNDDRPHEDGADDDRIRGTAHRDGH